MEKVNTYKNIFFRLIFFDHLDFQIIKVDGLYEIVLPKTNLGKTLEICFIAFQPEGHADVQLVAGFVQGAIDLGGPGVFGWIFNADRLDYVCLVKGSDP